MSQHPDQNAAIWQSGQMAATWAAEAAARERNHAAPWALMAGLLPFGPQDAFTFADLGAGTGNCARAVLREYPASTAVLADFSATMMGAGHEQMEPFRGRYRYLEFDLNKEDSWPAAMPATLDAVLTSLCVHHLPDQRKAGLFAEILARLVPGGWYLNYDPVAAADPVVTAAWQRAADRGDPEAARKRASRTPEEQARWDNHVRYIAPLRPQLDYLRAAGFAGVAVYYQRLEYVIFGGCRPG
ncbi:MAG TPA: class I SAM-dependent methyltransferase [Streptosporangiaceae bacterium]